MAAAVLATATTYEAPTVDNVNNDNVNTESYIHILFFHEKNRSADKKLFQQSKSRRKRDESYFVNKRKLMC